MDDNEKLSLKAQKAWQFTELLLARTDFQKDVEKFRDKWKCPWEQPGAELPDEEAQRKWKDERGLAMAEVFISSGKYNLDAYAWFPLLSYIDNGSTSLPFMGVMPVVNRVTDDARGISWYEMRFYDHTTEEEVRSAFNTYKAAYIKDRRRQLIPDLKLKKMKRAYELRKGGLPWKQVADIVNAELGGTLAYNDVRKLVKQYEDHHAGSPFFTRDI